MFSTQIGELLRSSFFGPVELNAVCVGHVIGFVRLECCLITLPSHPVLIVLGLMEDNHSCQ